MKKTCFECREEFDAPDNRYKFCGIPCSAKHQVGRKKNTRRNPKIITCIQCGNDIEYYGRTPRKFCDHKCKYQHQYETYITAWLRGKETGTRAGGTQISDHVRRWLFEKFGSKCQHCNWGEVNAFTGKVPLQVHHIDGNWKDSSPNNLELCCPNCHSLTETFGSRNTNGRPR